MKKIVTLLLAISAVLTFAASYPTTGARAFAVSSMNEVGALEAHYGKLLGYAEAKRDWVEAEMAGETGFLQTESLRIEVKELKRIHSEHAKSFNTRYTIFTKLRLI